MKSIVLLACAILSLEIHASSQVSSLTPSSKRGKNANPSHNLSPAQGEPVTCYSPAYNAPAAVNVTSKNWRGRPRNITSFVDASFIYWYAGEDGLAIAANGVLNSGTEYFAKKTTTFSQSFDYKPGFKVGIGIIGSYDWMLHTEYTWFRGRNTASSGDLSGSVPTAGSAVAASGTAVWVVNDWFLQGTPSQALSGSSVTSAWHLAMDLIDATASRPFYQGSYVITSPFGGLRVALIRQSMIVELTESAGLFSGAIPLQPIQSRNHSNSWAIGPRAGCESQFLLPLGFRIEGDLGISLLYTCYTSIKHSEDVAATTFNAGPYTASYTNYSCLRPELDLGLSIGWGRYLFQRDYHIDVSADYDFMIFWSQNMMRKLLDDVLTGTGPSSSELYLHGLTLTGRFDF